MPSGCTQSGAGFDRQATGLGDSQGQEDEIHRRRDSNDGLGHSGHRRPVPVGYFYRWDHLECFICRP